MNKYLPIVCALLNLLVVHELSGQASCPANNTCATAYTLTPASACVATTFNIAGCTDENVSGDCNDGLSAINTIWFRFIATSTAVTITADGNTGSDLVLGAFNNCTLSRQPVGGACVDNSRDAGI